MCSGFVKLPGVRENHQSKLLVSERISNVDEELADFYLHDNLPPVATLKVTSNTRLTCLSDLFILVQAAIRRTVIKRHFVPVFLGSALKNKGIQPLLDCIVDYLPNPGEVKNEANFELESKEVTRIILNPERSDRHPFVGLAFKLEAGKHGQLTYFRVYQGKVARGDQILNSRLKKRVRVQRLVRMHANRMEDIDYALAGDICAMFGVDCASGDTFISLNAGNIALENIHVPEPVVSLSITPKSLKDSDNFLKALSRFVKEDPTLKKEYNVESKETIVSGMGELQLEIYAQRMKSEYSCEVVLGKPKVAFRETLVADCPFDYWHRKQTGGHGQYGRVIGVCEPLTAAQQLDLEFVDECVGTNVPKPFMPAIERGFREACERGPLIGAKVVGVRFRLQDGAHHIVDSSDFAFCIASKFAMQDGKKMFPYDSRALSMQYNIGCTYVNLEKLQKIILTGGIEN
ncbi:unnamed protein product [Soboliphyme baturini]|uniref:EFG_IV domain-containing protein n=1 Tax=Soboliphyme baturini TaxID=241478 RepID=A0A183J5C5_9BILA|nr:unnamed protein product [Soboliphyme baturini]